jgi:hypothetical protein
MAYQIIQEDTGIHLKLDELEDAELLAANSAMLHLPNFSSFKYVICDATGAKTSKLTIPGVRAIAEQDADFVALNPGAKVAVVANKQVIRGLTNVYRVYLEQASDIPGWETEYFTNLSEARRWLGLEDDTASESASTSGS